MPERVPPVVPRRPAPVPERPLVRSDDFCQSLRTPDHRPGTPYGEVHRCLPSGAGTGMLDLDVAHGRICFIEVTDRPAMIRRDL